MDQPLPYFDNTPLPTLSELNQAISRLEQRETLARLPLRRIKLVPEAFNARGTKLDEYALGQLGRGLAASGDLRPVLVLPCRGGFILIDGHHRLEAYRRAERRDIPVVPFKGTVREAVAEGTKLNAETKVAMSNTQRQNRAWQLVNADFTIRQTSIASGVAQSQVSIMRKARKALGDEAAGLKSWWQARRMAAGRAMEQLTDEEQEAMIDAHAADRSYRLNKTFGSKLRDNPTITAKALRIYMGREYRMLALEMRNLLTDDEAEWVQNEFAPLE